MTITTKKDLTEIFENYSDEMYRYVYLRVGRQKETAEDLTQDVFVKVWRYREKFDGNKSAIRTWLYTVARTIIIDYYRREGHRKHYTVVSDDNTTNIVDEGSTTEREDTQLMAEDLINKLDLLNDTDKELLILRYIHDLEINEIAKIRKKSYVAIKVGIHRALKRFKSLLAQRD